MGPHRTIGCLCLCLVISVLSVDGVLAETPQIDRSAEPAALATLNGKATRKGSSLVLSTRGGSVEFRDGHWPNSKDGECGYIFVKRISGRAFLVELIANEYYRYLWVRESDGHVVELRDKPLLSPGGQYFAVISTCDGFGGCILQVWKTDGPKLVFEYEPKEYADFQFTSWVTNNRVQLDVGAWSNGKLQYTPAEIARTGSAKWVLKWQQNN